jgi:hypothetical protein
MANLAKKKKMGKGQYNQDYVDESQVNYMGSPLDIYYQVPKKEALEQKRERGENVGSGVKKSKGMARDMIEMGETGGKMSKDLADELIKMAEKGNRKMGKKLRKVKGGEMSFMKGQTHAGMSMPTEEQFKRGGKVKKEPEHQLDISGAIHNLAMLAQKFGLKLIK